MKPQKLSLEVPLSRVIANPWQTRQAHDAEHVAELAADIAANGLLQKPAGRLVPDPDRDESLSVMMGAQEKIYQVEHGWRLVQLAFGHNRLAAYELLAEQDPEKWGRIPVEIRDLADEQMADHAWAENERRQDHNPIDRALFIQKCMADFGWNQEAAAEHLRMSRPAVTNALRLLKLPEDLQGPVKAGDLSERQAVALLPLTELPKEMLKRAKSYWNDPDAIIAGALDGHSSDRIRKDVDSLIKQFSKELEDALWPLDHPFEGNGFVAPTCRDCPVRMKHQNRCPNQTCFDLKERAWKLERLTGASAASGIQPADVDAEYWKFFSFYGEQEFAPAVRANSCKHLHLHYAGTVHEGTEYRTLADLGFPDVDFICDYKKGSDRYCECLRALKGGANQVDEKDIKRREAEQRANKTRVKELLYAGAQIFAQGLVDGQVEAWRRVLYQVDYRERDDSGKLALDELQVKIGACALSVPWFALEDPVKALEELNKQLSGFGLPEIEPVEEVNA